MKKLNKLVLILMIVALCFLSAFALAGCGDENYEMSQAKRAKVNVQKEANNFNVERRIVVYNARTDFVICEIIGYFSVSNGGNNELEITCEVNQNTYKVNYIYLTEYTLYFIEDISGAHVDPYHYEIHYIPEMIQPFTITRSK